MTSLNKSTKVSLEEQIILFLGRCKMAPYVAVRDFVIRNLGVTVTTYEGLNEAMEGLSRDGLIRIFYSSISRIHDGEPALCWETFLEITDEGREAFKAIK